jgi:hypothetical protein
MTTASREVMAIRDSEDPDLGITLVGAEGGQRSTLLQLAELVFVVGNGDFNVLVYDLAVWLDTTRDGQPRHSIACSTAREAFQELQARAALSELRWTCGGCDAPIYTVERRTAGILECATCGEGGTDFDFHFRHLGDD